MAANFRPVILIWNPKLGWFQYQMQPTRFVFISHNLRLTTLRTAIQVCSKPK